MINHSCSFSYYFLLLRFLGSPSCTTIIRPTAVTFQSPGFSDILTVIVSTFAMWFLCLWQCWKCCKCCKCFLNNVQRLEASAESGRRPAALVPRQANIEICNERSFHTQRVITNATLPTSTGSREQQVLESNDSHVTTIELTSVVLRTSSLPPAYDDALQQNSVTITNEEPSLQPPSYDDFLRKNNERV